MTITTLLAIAAIVGQGLVVWCFLRFVKTFGDFTASNKEATKVLLFLHESNLLVHQHNLKVLDELRATKLSLEGRVA